MHLATLFTASAALLAPITSVLANGQVNFYYDTNCQDYAGSSYPDYDQVVGYNEFPNPIATYVHTNPIAVAQPAQNQCCLSMPFPALILATIGGSARTQSAMHMTKSASWESAKALGMESGPLWDAAVIKRPVWNTGSFQCV
jgi:hypothetical protein